MKLFLVMLFLNFTHILNLRFRLFLNFMCIILLQKTVIILLIHFLLPVFNFNTKPLNFYYI